MRLDLAEISGHSSGRRDVFNWDSLSSFNDGPSWERILSDEELEIDLGGFNYLGHDGVIWVAFILKLRKYRNLSSYVSLPEDEDQIAFLKYIGFDELQNSLAFSFTDDFKLYFAREKYKATDPLLKSLRKLRVVTSDNWNQLNYQAVQDVRSYLLRELMIPATDARGDFLVRPFTETMTELISNITLHGGKAYGSGSGIVSLTPPPARSPYIDHCFADIGYGFRSTLEGKFRNSDIEISDDREAVLRGLLFRYWYKSSAVVGLYPILHLIRNRNGSIRIRSGEALVSIELSSKKNQKRFDDGYQSPTLEWLEGLCSARRLPNIPGAHVHIRMSIPPRGKTPNEGR